MEVALCEGVWERILWAGAGRVYDRWHLASGVRLNHDHPETFWIPKEEEKEAITPGVHVKLLFDTYDLWWRRNWGERMWVEVVAIKKRHIVGVLMNEPFAIPRLYFGDRVKFKRDHIIDIVWEPRDFQHAAENSEPPHVLPLHEGCNGPFERLAEAAGLPPPESEHRRDDG